MSLNDFTFRAAAVVAAVAVVAGPYLVAKAKSFAERTKGWKARPQEQADDAHTVIEIARRLQKAGNARGVELCQQLIDVMLSVGAQ